MSHDRKSSSDHEYDLLVIGGGINGAAVANIAAAEGLRVILLEKGDFAGGTSSKSTKLIHGGLRYLEQCEFGLVYEALHERALLLKSVGHLVSPLSFIVPVYQNGPRPFWMMKLGVWLYDQLSGRYVIEPQRTLSRDDVLRAVPGINPQGLQGAVAYTDAQMDDARLCLENILSARQKGASVLNYCEVTALLKEREQTLGVEARNVLTKDIFEVHAKNVVCTLGPWTNQFLADDFPKSRHKVRLTKGVHLVHRQRFADQAVFLQAQKERRIFFVIPWGAHTLIGTTDTDYPGRPDDVRVEPADIEYLLGECRRFFPRVSLERQDIVTSFAGLRPLVHERGHPSHVSRKHVIVQSPSGVFYLMGGKYTTFRPMAVECVEKVLRRKIKSSADYPLYGSGPMDEKSVDAAVVYGVDAATVDYLKSKYGIRYTEVLRLTQENPLWKRRICDCSLAIEAQVVYAIRTELAKQADDVIWRRLGIGYLDCSSQRCRAVIREHFEERETTRE